MIRPRWKKVLSDLWSNRMRSLLVVASIAVGLFAVGMIAVLYVTLRDDMRIGYEKTNPANIQVFVSPFNQKLVEQLADVQGVAQAEGVNNFSVQVRAPGGEWQAMNIQAFPEIKSVEINTLVIEQGSWPPKAREVAVDRYKLASLGVPLGGELEVELPSGIHRSLKLTAVVHDQSIGSAGAGGGFFMAPAQGYIDVNTLAWLEQPTTLNKLYITVTGDRESDANIRTVAARVTDEMEKRGLRIGTAINRRGSEHPNSTYIEAMSAVLFLLGLLVVFLSAFLITNTFQALLKNQTQQIGVMKTLGARSRQIVLIYMAQIFLFGLLALAVSLPSSRLAAYGLLKYLTFQINFDLQPAQPVPLAIILQTVIALVVPQLAGFTPIFHGSHISVQEAISGIEQENAFQREGWLDRFLARIRGLSRPMLISLRNIFRRPGRLAMTLFTLTLGGAVFIATFNTRASLVTYITRVGHYFRADVNLTLDQPYNVTKIRKLLMQEPGVALVEGWSAAQGDLILENGEVGGNISILAPPAGSSLVEPILVAGRWVEPGDRNVVAVSERFLSVYPNLKPGDMVRFKLAGEESNWKVVGIFQLVGKSAGLIAYSTFDSVSPKVYQYGKSYAFRVASSQAGMTTAEQKAFGKRLEERLRREGYSVVEMTTGFSLNQSSTDGLNILTTFLLIMAVLTALVGSIGLMGTMTMNVMERTREIGVMRAIGASDRAIIRLVMVEGVVIGLFSWVLGVIAAVPISYVMADGINQALFDAPTTLSFTPSGVLIWLGLVMLLAALASIIPARSAARLTIREVLAYE